MKRTVVCEYVGFGHPDAVADQVSDALLDEFLKQDPNTCPFGRVSETRPEYESRY